MIPIRTAFLLFGFAALQACLGSAPGNSDQQATIIEMHQAGTLPAAVSNNAVALMPTEDGPVLMSFLGLGANKTWQDIQRSGFGLRTLDAKAVPAESMQPVPVAQGRLAASAVSLAPSDQGPGGVYLFGGYTVAEDGSEVSTPEVFRIINGEYQRETDMPVPVDDAVAVVYQNRYIYLVSGWHDLGNVNLVQVYDTRERSWSQATQYPGAAVFGHAGGLMADRLVICDGVRIEYPTDGSARRFLPSTECWLGIINADDHRRIQWIPLPPHPGIARYRMAASTEWGRQSSDRVVFAGGSGNPYNFNGIGYDGRPAEPESLIFAFDFAANEWLCFGQAAVATMDHRGLVQLGDWYFIAGGMLSGQRVSAAIYRFELPSTPVSCNAHRVAEPEAQQ